MFVTIICFNMTIVNLHQIVTGNVTNIKNWSLTKVQLFHKGALQSILRVESLEALKVSPPPKNHKMFLNLIIRSMVFQPPTITNVDQLNLES